MGKGDQPYLIDPAVNLNIPAEDILNGKTNVDLIIYVGAASFTNSGFMAYAGPILLDGNKKTKDSPEFGRPIVGRIVYNLNYLYTDLTDPEKT